MLPGSVWRMHVESLSKPGYSASLLEALPGKLDIKRHSPTLCMSIIQQGEKQR